MACWIRGAQAHLRFDSLVVGPLLAASLAPATLCAPAPDPNTGKPVFTWAEAVSRVSDANLPFRTERLEAYEALLLMEPAERDRGLRALMARNDEWVAVMAAQQMIRHRLPDAGATIVKVISGWSESNQAVVLGEILTLGIAPALREIPRVVLRSARPGRSHVEAGSLITRSPAELAAVLLADSAEAADRELIRSALHRAPETHGLWVALAAAGDVGGDDLALAVATFNDAKLPRSTRVAAAVAAAPRDRSAAEFAEAEIGAFIDRFGQMDDVRILGDLLERREGGRVYLEFQRSLSLIGMLRHLRTEAAEKLTFAALGARNELMRQPAALVAAWRWPERLIRTGQGQFSQDEYVNVLAALAQAHPHLAVRAQELVPEVRLIEVTERIREGGLMGRFGVLAWEALGL